MRWIILLPLVLAACKPTPIGRDIPWRTAAPRAVATPRAAPETVPPETVESARAAQSEGRAYVAGSGATAEEIAEITRRTMKVQADLRAAKLHNTPANRAAARVSTKDLHDFVKERP